MNPDEIVDDMYARAEKILEMIDCPICEYWRIQPHQKVCTQCVEKLKDFAITSGMRFDHEPASL